MIGRRIRLSDAQVSAIECRPEEDFDLVDGRYLVVRADTEEQLCEASNAEDAFAEYVCRDPEGRKYARRAARSLASLHGKVLRLAAAEKERKP